MPPEDPMCDAVQAILAHDGQGLGREAQLQIQPWGVDLGSITQPVRLRHSRHDEEIPFAAVERTLARLCDALHAGATVGRRIRWAGERHVPVIVIIGPREAEHGTLSVRLRGGEQSDNVPPGVVERALVGAARDRAVMPGF